MNMNIYYIIRHNGKWRIGGVYGGSDKFHDGDRGQYEEETGDSGGSDLHPLDIFLRVIGSEYGIA